jgi:hypothetical protein
MPSHSPWASNVVLVMKKDNSLRMCVGLGWIVTGCSSHITALGGIVMFLVVTLEICIVIWPLFLKLNRIELLEDKTFKQRYRRIPPSMYDEVKVYLQQLLDMNIIRPSHSPWASNVVLVGFLINSQVILQCVEVHSCLSSSSCSAYDNQHTFSDCYNGERLSRSQPNNLLRIYWRRNYLCKTYEEQLHNLQLVFDRIKAANLKLCT